MKGSTDHGLFYSWGSLSLQAYYDSDWAGDLDDRRSITSFGVFLGPCLVSWCAKKQSVVSKSSTEAEYCAIAMVTAELYWLQMVLKDMQISITAPPLLQCDNLGAIEVDYHFIREKVLNKDISPILSLHVINWLIFLPKD